MKKIVIITSLLFCSSFAKEAKTQVMHAQDHPHASDYSNSSSARSQKDAILSSTAEMSIQLSTVITSEASEAERRSQASMSYLDQNRVEITDDMAKGEGEYLETLLSLMELKKDNKTMSNIQNNFDDLINLPHKEFLTKLKTLA